VQVEHGLASSADDMNMGGPMIVRVDHGSWYVKAKDCRHN
jgi:hypothetical protein